MKALVTGASSGIGRDIAYYLSDIGYDLVLVARDEKGLEETRNNCKTNCDIVSLDLSDTSNCYKLYEDYKDKIDVLVNGAGFGLFGVTAKTDLDT